MVVTSGVMIALVVVVVAALCALGVLSDPPRDPPHA